jgi:hypothetical protein
MFFIGFPCTFVIHHSLYQENVSFLQKDFDFMKFIRLFRSVVLNRCAATPECAVEFVQVCRQILKYHIKYIDTVLILPLLIPGCTVKIFLSNKCTANSKRLRNTALDYMIW